MKTSSLFSLVLAILSASLASAAASSSSTITTTTTTTGTPSLSSLVILPSISEVEDPTGVSAALMATHTGAAPAVTQAPLLGLAVGAGVAAAGWYGF
ncbi:hypothetical protein F4677DRAFT_441332 [Hypoxylon crocopeplum]|nr:hypothetical protein F4677DRAFT_441332 [Hypoxylon crocopeplum]